MRNKTKQIISVLIIAGMLGYYFIFPFSVKTADAFAWPDLNITLSDIPRKLEKLGKSVIETGLKKLKKRLLTQIQNDLVNSVQNGGMPRFIKHFGNFYKGAIDTAAVTALDKVFKGTGMDICSPFKLNVEFLVNRAVYQRDSEAGCTLGDIKDNLVAFGEDFTNGGWTSWIKLHETNNTLPGAYLAALETVNASVEREGNAATAQVSAGKGFLDQKVCRKAHVRVADSVCQDADTGAEVSCELFEECNADSEEFEGFGEAVEGGDFEHEMVTIPCRGRRISRISGGSSYEIDYIKDTGKAVPMSSLPPNSTCTETETVTPGSMIGEWVGGGLKSIGVDSIINSNDLTTILNAVLDSAVNRAMKDGLSLITSGRGTYTTAYRDRGAQTESQAQLEGLESPEGISLQNQLSELRNNANKLKADLSKLAGKDDIKLGKFNSRTNQIAGYKNADNTFTEGILNEGRDNCRLRAASGDKKFSDVIDRLYNKYTHFLVTDGLSLECGDGVKDRIITFSDKSNFREEYNMPGLYFANQSIYRKMSEVWREIGNVFENLSTNGAYGEKTSCKDIQYTLKPAILDGTDKLPFTNPNGSSVGWSSPSQSYFQNMKEDAGITDSADILISDFQSYALAQSYEAESKSDYYIQLAESYDTLIENVSGVMEGLSDDIGFTTSILPNSAFFTSILMDYDRAGKTFELVQKIKSYNEALGKNNDRLIETSYNTLLEAQRQTRSAWLAGQREIAVSILPEITAEEKTKAGMKIEVIENTNILIENSLREIQEGLPEDSNGNPIINPTQLGLKVSSAVAQAMRFEVESVKSELEERQTKISKQQTDVSNQLGNFISDENSRKEAGLEGGDTEWEKHFENRFQLAYSVFIYDFYKDHFVSNFCKR